MLRRVAWLLCLTWRLDLVAQLVNGPDFRVNVATSDSQEQAHVVLNGDHFAVVYHLNGAGAVPYFRLFDRGAQPSTGELPLAGFGGTPAVARHAGGFVAAFQAAGTEIRAQRFDASGALVGADFRVNQYTSGTRGSPDVATTPDGGFIVTWTGDGADDTNGIFAARFDAAGGRVADDFRVNTYTSGNQFKSSIAFSGGGSPEFLIAWAGQGATDGDGIFAKRYDKDGNALTGDFRVNTSTSGTANYPSVAADPGGPAFVVSWDFQHPTPDVFAQKLNKTGVPLGGEFRVNATSPAGRPTVGFETTTSFVVAYAGSSVIRGQRFSFSSGPLGAEFLVSTATTGSNTDPAIAVEGPGSYVVVWTNSVRDGSESGVFGQLVGPRGDANGDGIVDVVDVFYVINFLFAGGADTLGAADADSSGTLDVADVFYVINYLFASGPPPAA